MVTLTLEELFVTLTEDDDFVTLALDELFVTDVELEDLVWLTDELEELFVADSETLLDEEDGPAFNSSQSHACAGALMDDDEEELDFVTDTLDELELFVCDADELDLV